MIGFNANDQVSMDVKGHGGNVKTAIGSYLLAAPLRRDQTIPMVAGA